MLAEEDQPLIEIELAEDRVIVFDLPDGETVGSPDGSAQSLA